jgi:hypothetical protein
MAFKVKRQIRKCPVLTILVAASTLSSAGCTNKEQCDEGVRVTRDALTKEQTELARQWREYTWKVCQDAQLVSQLDREILDKETEIRKRAEDEAKKIGEAAQQRMTQAGKVWVAFDELDEKRQTRDRLLQYKDKAAKMGQGLPEEYVKQIEDYNEREFERRDTRLAKKETKR